VGWFDSFLNADGWGRLEVHTCGNSGMTEEDQMHAAGWVESKLTGGLMESYWNNYKAAEYGASGGEPPEALVAFMGEQLDWARAQVRAHEGDEYWGRVGVLLAQYDGFVQGYQSREPPPGKKPAFPPLTEAELYLLNSVGDLEELNTLFARARPSAASAAHVPQFERDELTDCSALITVGADGALKAAHATWRRYYAMLRVWKLYDFGSVTGRRMSFSSSPGLLHSKDDFYHVQSLDNATSLVIMETTNSVFDQKLLSENTSPQTLLSWQRAMLGNWFAGGGREWVETFEKENSGTYNNQWMVLDHSRVSDVREGAWTDVLWIVEQSPGQCEHADVSGFLQTHGYWASYNIPYLEAIYDRLGYAKKKEQAAQAGGDPNEYDYDGCARAQIFRRDHAAVEMQALIRQNDYKNDALSGGNPLHAVASRGDLPSDPALKLKRVAFGAVDAKVYSGKESAIAAVCGPTSDQQAPFTWDDPLWANVNHTDVPDAFDFPWSDMPSA